LKYFSHFFETVGQVTAEASGLYKAYSFRLSVYLLAGQPNLKYVLSVCLSVSHS